MKFLIIFAFCVSFIIVLAIVLAYLCCFVVGKCDEYEEREFEERHHSELDEYYNGNEEHDQQVDAAWFE